MEIAGGIEVGKRTRWSGRIGKLMEICESLGLGEYNEVLGKLRDIYKAEAYKRKKLAQDLFGKPSLKEGVEEALRGLILED